MRLSVTALIGALLLGGCGPSIDADYDVNGNPATPAVQPNLGLGLGIGPNGVRVVPRVSATMGDVNIGTNGSSVGVGANLGGVSVNAGI